MKVIDIKPTRIRKEDPVPYYYQIVEALRETIMDTDDPEVNEKVALPSEPELSEIFSVNRGTVRHALQVLEKEGLIFREKGKGTFIRRRRVEMDLSYLCSTTEDMRNRGWEPATQVLGISLVFPRDHIRESLQLDENEKVWEIYRSRTANGEPISLQRAFFPYKYFPELDQKDVNGSFYELWLDEYHIEPFDGEQTIRTRLATKEEANLLQIGKYSPIFEITRITYDANNSPFEYLISIWRGDRYDFYVRLSKRYV
jgi:GntR family transcriptional regulator